MVYTEYFNTECLIEIGRTQLENDKLVRLHKLAGGADKTIIWFHLGGGDSSGHGFATIPTSNYTKGTQLYKECIYRAATLVKSFSKRKDDKHVSIIYTIISNVALTTTRGLVTLNDSKKVYTVKI
jgi:hypothetical protein